MTLQDTFGKVFTKAPNFSATGRSSHALFKDGDATRWRYARVSRCYTPPYGRLVW